MAIDYNAMISEAKKRKREAGTALEYSSGNNDYVSAIKDAKLKKQKVSLEQTINFDTFQSDLSSMGKTIGDIYGGWQTAETMNNTRSAVNNMYNRINAYQEYRSLFGGNDAPDLSELASNYKYALDEWDNATTTYGKYKSADEYRSAVDFNKEAIDILNGEKSVDIEQLDSEIASLEERLETTKHYEKNIEIYDIQKRKYEETHSDDGGYGSKLDVEKAEYNDYLTMMGYSPMTAEEVEKALSRKKAYKNMAMSAKVKDMTAEDIAPYLNNKDNPVAYTTTDGKNVTWQKLYDTKKYEEETDALYNEISSRNDFAEYKNKGANIENPTFVEAEGWGNIFGWRPGAKEVGNIVEYSIVNEAGIGLAALNSKDAVGDVVYATITDKERALYNYYLGRERAGLENEGAADNYLKSIYGVLKDRYEQKVIGGMEKLADEHPVMASALSIGQNLGAGVEYVFDAVNYARTGELDTNHLAEASSTIRNTVSQKVDWEIDGWDAFDFLYNTGMSMADSAVSMAAFGGAGGVALGLSAAAQGTNEALDRGLDNKSAFWNGFASGAFEGIFESVSIGKFKALKESSVDGGKAIIKNVGKSMLTNASEETLTELANIMYDTIVNGDLSQYETKIRAYMNTGLSESEAKKKVALEFGRQVAEAGASGALMGVGFGGVSQASAYAKTRGKGSSIRSKERVNDMIEMASLSPEESEAYQAYSEYAKKGITADNIKNAQLGNLYYSAETDAKTTLGSKKSSMSQKADAFKTLHKLQSMNTENVEAKKAKERAGQLTIGEVTEVSATGNSAKIEGIKLGKDTVLITNEGEISADDMTLTERDALLVGYAEQMPENEANLFLSQDDGKTDVERYHTSFTLAMEYSKHRFTEDTILEHRGVLSPTQVKNIYEATVKESYAAEQKALDDLSAKHGKGMFVQGAFDDSVIDYKSKTTDGSKVNWKTLTTKQRGAIKFAKLFSKATGVNIRLFQSKVENGKHVGENGSYDPETNTISIDVFAGRIDAGSVKDSIIPTLSHELTHWMERKAPSLYNVLREDILKTIAKDKRMTTEEIVDAEMSRMKETNPDMEVTPEKAINEIVARACEDMLANSAKARELLAKMSPEEQKGFVAKVKETLDNLIKWVNDLLSHYKSTSEEAKVLRKYKDELNKASKIWDEMLESAIAANQALQKEGKTETSTKKEDVQLQPREYDSNGNEYWQIESNKDIFKGIENIKALKKAAYDFILSGDKGDKVLGLIDGENLEFIRVSAKEYVYGAASQTLSETEYKQKMRMATSVIDLIDNAQISYDSPDHKTHKLFPNGFKNYQGRVGIDETIFRYIVRVGKAKNGMIFYDINLEVDGKVPRANRTSLIKSSTSNNSISNSDKNVKKNFGNKSQQQNSDRDQTSIYDKMGETERLEKENAILKAAIDRLKERLKLEGKVTGGRVLNENQLMVAAGHLRNIAKSNYSKDALVNEIRELRDLVFKPMWTKEDLEFKCAQIADNLLSEAKPEKITNDYAKMILRVLRSTRISLSETQIQEAKHIFGSNYRNSFMGKVVIAKDGISLDSQWQEWANQYPDFFKADVNEADQIVQLYEIYDNLRDTSEMIMEYDMEEQRKALEHEVFNICWKISNITTTADKYEAKIKELNYAHRKTMKELRDSYEERMAEWKKDYRAKTAELVRDMRERKDAEIAEARKAGRERLATYKENAERKTVIQRITGNALTLNKWLTDNSKDYHIHEAMKGPVIKLLQAIDFSSKRMIEKGVPTQNDVTFNEAFAEVKSMLEGATNMVVGFEELYGHDLAEDINTLSKMAYRLVGDNNYVINSMTLEELQSLDKLVRYIKKVVSEVNKFHTIHHNQGAVNLANEFMEHGEKIGNLKKQHGKVGKFLEIRNRTPYYFFKDLGEVGTKIFEAFQDGWDKLAFNVKQIIDFTNETYKAKEVKKWSKETKEFTVPQLDGSNRTFKMSIAQIMALHCVSKQADAMTHLLSGGMTLKRFDKKGRVIADYENIGLTKHDIESIIGTLDNRQREVADELQKFMNTICSAWGNEISMARFGSEMFGLPDYFPIKVSEATVPTDNTKDVDNASLFRLLNMSFTKSRNEYADGSIEIGDIFDVFAQHASDMAKYNALALPVLDFNKFYSIHGKDSSNKEYGVVVTLKSVFGDEANGYLRRFVRDLNGSQNVSRDVIGNTFFKNAKLASVAANLRVVLLQPTAYYKASAILDNKYLIKAGAYMKYEPIGMYSRFKKAVEKAEKYCGIVQWKSLGYYDTDISKGLTGKIKHAETFKDKAVDVSMKGAEIADKATFATLWVACEFEIKDTRKDLKVGSKEYYEAVGKRLRDVIYATQVVDSTMTRSDMMRSSDGMDKMYTTFGSESIIAYNMLLDRVMQYNHDKKEFGKKEARKRNFKKTRKVITAYVVTNAMAALVESAFDAFREDDDEEMDMVKFIELYLKNFALDMSIGNKLPIIKEVYSVMQGYSSSRMDTQWLSYLQYALNTKKPEKAFKNLLKAFSQVSGLAFYNVYRDLIAALNKLDIFTTEDLEEMFDGFTD